MGLGIGGWGLERVNRVQGYRPITRFAPSPAQRERAGVRALFSHSSAYGPLTLVLSHFEFEGFRTVMPALRLRSGQAPAGIQGEQAAASGYSAWIPAFAGMTQPSSTPQNHHDRLLVFCGIDFEGLSF